MKTTRTCWRLFAFASLATVAASANALSVDPQITIDRALNSPTLAVRYTGVAATLVELRVNGESMGTREVAGGRSLGETSFTLDLDALKNGDNLVEIRLFDRTGKLVAQDKTNISMEKSVARGAVFVSTPKPGSSVLGPVEINVGFGEKLGNSYVSFFVDGQFKSMTNFPPFTFVWDTEKEANGWHDVEAWAIDERNETHKSGAVRLFVNNPGGRTERVGVPKVAAVVPTRNLPRDLSLVGTEAGLRAMGAATTAVRITHALPQGLPPALTTTMVPLSNAVRAAVTGANAVRPLVLANALAMGPKSLVPVGRRVGAPAVKTGLPTIAKVPVARVDEALVAATTMVSVAYGTRLPNLGAYAVLLNGMPVRFDVPTRVENGLALAPLRALVEKAGGKIEWVAATRTVHAGAGGHTVELRIGDATARVDGANLVLERAPGIASGRTIVPLSFLHDALGMDVKLDKATGNVVVSTRN